MVGALLLLAADSGAEQALVFDEDVQWENEAEYERLYTGPVAQYKEGKAYLCMDVTSKPTSYEVGAQVCIWHYHPGLGEACSWADQTRFTDEGTSYFDMGKPSEWWSGEAGVDWSVNMSEWQDMRILIRDPANGMCQFRASGPGACSNIGAHLPILFHVTLYLVAEGDRLAAPAGWECPLEWNCDEATGVEGMHTASKRSSSPYLVVKSVGPDGVVRFSVAGTVKGRGRLNIYDAGGAMVATIGVQERESIAWDAGAVAPGVYTARLESGEMPAAGRVVLVK